MNEKRKPTLAQSVMAGAAAGGLTIAGGYGARRIAKRLRRRRQSHVSVTKPRPTDGSIVVHGKGANAPGMEGRRRVKRAAQRARDQYDASAVLPILISLDNQIMETTDFKNAIIPAPVEPPRINKWQSRARKAAGIHPQGKVLGLSKRGKRALKYGAVGAAMAPLAAMATQAITKKGEQNRISKEQMRESRRLKSEATHRMRHGTRAPRGVVMGAAGGTMAGGVLGGPTGAAVGSGVGSFVGEKIGRRIDRPGYRTPAEKKQERIARREARRQRRQQKQAQMASSQKTTDFRAGRARRIKNAVGRWADDVSGKSIKRVKQNRKKSWKHVDGLGKRERDTMTRVSGKTQVRREDLANELRRIKGVRRGTAAGAAGIAATAGGVEVARRRRAKKKEAETQEYLAAISGLIEFTDPRPRNQQGQFADVTTAGSNPDAMRKAYGSEEEDRRARMARRIRRKLPRGVESRSDVGVI